MEDKDEGSSWCCCLWSKAPQKDKSAPNEPLPVATAKDATNPAAEEVNDVVSVPQPHLSPKPRNPNDEPGSSRDDTTRHYAAKDRHSQADQQIPEADQQISEDDEPERPKDLSRLWKVAATQVYGDVELIHQDPGRDVRETIKDIKGYFNEKEADKWPSRGKKLLNILLRIDSLVNAGLAFDPTPYGKLVWSVVSFGLSMAKSHQDIQDFILENSVYTGSLMERYAVYEARYLPDLPREVGCAPSMAALQNVMENAIVDVYAKILKFSNMLNDTIKQALLKNLVDAVQLPEDHELFGLKKKVEIADAHAKSITEQLDQEQTNDFFKDIQHKIAQLIEPFQKLDERIQSLELWGQRQDQDTLLKWIFSEDMVGRQVDMRNKGKQYRLPDSEVQLPGPGEWFLGSPAYREWQNSTTSQGLILRGTVGTGKSIITSAVIERAYRIYDTAAFGALAYVYCRDGNVRLNPTGILRSFLRQLASSETCYSVIEGWLREGNSKALLDNEAVVRLITKIVDLNSDIQTIIIIDGIDEVENTNDLARLLQLVDSLTKRKDRRCKVLISSRMGSKLDEHIDEKLSSWPRHELRDRETMEDMELFIKLGLDALLSKKVSPKFREDLEKLLKSRAKGMFQYIDLAFKWIFLMDEENIEMALKKLPEGLDGIYEDMFERIDGRIGQPAIQYAIASVSPMKSSVFIAMVDTQTSEKPSKEAKNIVSKKTLYLLEHNERTDCFEVAHISILQFLERPTTLNGPPKIARFSLPRAHAAMAEWCLDTLFRETLHPPVGDSNPKVLNEQYAMVYWAVHCGLGDAGSADPSLQLAKLFKRFFSSKSHLFGRWREMFSESWSQDQFSRLHIPQQVMTKWDDTFPEVEQATDDQNFILEDANRFLISCAFNICGTITKLPGQHALGSLLSMRTSTGKYGQHVAATYGNAKVLRELFEIEGFNPNVRVKSEDNRYPVQELGPTLLHLATKNDMKDIVKVLVERKDTDVNAHYTEGVKFNTALHDAVEMHNSHIVEILLDSKHTDILTRDHWARTPLDAASCRLEHLSRSDMKRREDCQKIRDLFREHRYGSLHYAIREKAAKDFEAELIRLNREDPMFSSNLVPEFLLAIEHNSKEIRNKISDKVDINSKDRTGYTALMVAMLRSKPTTARSPSTSSSSHGGSNADMVRFLIDRNAGTEIASPLGLRILELAVDGHAWPENVKTLVESRKVKLDEIYERETTVLAQAIEANRELMVKTLIKGKANVLVHNVSDGQTPLHVAARCGNPIIFKECLSALDEGDGLTALDSNDSTILMEAVKNGQEKIVKPVIESNRQYLLNAQDSKGRTALWWACSSMNPQLVNPLVRAMEIFVVLIKITNIDIGLPDKQEQSPYDIALLRKQESIANDEKEHFGKIAASLRILTNLQHSQVTSTITRASTWVAPLARPIENVISDQEGDSAGVGLSRSEIPKYRRHSSAVPSTSSIHNETMGAPSSQKTPAISEE